MNESPALERRRAATAPRPLVWIGLSLSVVAGVAAAGDLEPSAPPGPTMKPLSDIEPRTAIRNDPTFTTPVKIQQSGSYYLAEDILGLGAQHGIEIAASHVSLDLNGFSVIGSETGSLSGIYVAPAGTPEQRLLDIRVRNGTVRGFTEEGIGLADVRFVQLDAVAALGNGGDGIEVGDYARVVDCIAADNQGFGIDTQKGTLLVRSLFADNVGDGVNCFTSGGCVMVQTVTAGNDGGVLLSGGVLAESLAIANSGTDVTVVGGLVNGNMVGSPIVAGGSNLVVHNYTSP